MIRSAIFIAAACCCLTAQRDSLAQTAPAFVDVRLDESGALRGQVVDSQGSARAHRQVVVERQGRPIATAQTDSEGRFTAAGLKGGAYLVTCNDAAVPCRLWSAAAAPPSSRSALLVTEHSPIARGQNRMRTLVRTVAICSAVGAGIAVPLVLIEQEDDRQQGS